MKKILTAISLMLGFAMPSFADEREQLIGVWKLQTYELEFQDTGERKTQFGEHPNGFLIFTAEGRMMAVLTAESRPIPQTDSDRAAALGSMFAYSVIPNLIRPGPCLVPRGINLGGPVVTLEPVNS